MSVDNTLGSPERRPQTAQSVGDLFMCPIWSGDLDRLDEGPVWPGCHRGYPIDDGITDFRV